MLQYRYIYTKQTLNKLKSYGSWVNAFKKI